MTNRELDIFEKETTCIYKGECYSVRDNGAVLRHSHETGRKRKDDDIWTLGTSIDDKGFYSFRNAKIQQIVATAFLGMPPTSQYVVFYKNYNKRDNRIENLAWVTKFEYHIFQPQVQSQLRIVTSESKLEKILSDFEQYKVFLPQNLSWMRSFSQEDADKCLQKYIDLKFSIKEEKKLLEWNSQESREIIKKLRPNIHLSLTPNAAVAGNMIPSYFLCCPKTITENPLQAYFENLKTGNTYYMNKHYKTIVLEAAFYKEKQKIIVKCESGDGEEAIKPWSVSTITFENGVYLHTLYKTCFERKSADKYFTILQDKEWTGGDVPDDFC